MALGTTFVDRGLIIMAASHEQMAQLSLSASVVLIDQFELGSRSLLLSGLRTMVLSRSA